MLAVEIRPVSVESSEDARAVHSIQMAAYAQEAALLGVKTFPPLERTVQDIQFGAERFLGAWAATSLVGVLGYEFAADGPGMTISSLVVSPGRQRRGVGRLLVLEVLARFADLPVAVSTGAKNRPALALYTGSGFVEHSRGLIGPEKLEIVSLLRAAP